MTPNLRFYHTKIIFFFSSNACIIFHVFPYPRQTIWKCLYLRPVKRKKSNAYILFHVFLYPCPTMWKRFYPRPVKWKYFCKCILLNDNLIDWSRGQTFSSPLTKKSQNNMNPFLPSKSLSGISINCTNLTLQGIASRN